MTPAGPGLEAAPFRGRQQPDAIPDIPRGGNSRMLDRQDILTKAAEYRRNAQACEKLARTTTIYPAIGQQLRDLAEQWRVLAGRVESITRLD
jgi:hypothetical protein